MFVSGELEERCKHSRIVCGGGHKHIRYSYHFLSPLNGPVSFARVNLKGGKMS